MNSRLYARVLRVSMSIALILLLQATIARADGLFVPFIGYDFGGDAGSCRTITPCSPRQTTYGGSLGFMLGGVFGLEGDFAYAPHFFGEGTGLSDNHVLTFMGNALVGIPLGPVRLFGVGGVGVIHTDVSQSSAGLYNAFTNNNFAFDLGGGLMVFFSKHVGVRGDLRYFRTFDELTFVPYQLNNVKVQYGRATIGVAFSF